MKILISLSIAAVLVCFGLVKAWATDVPPEQIYNNTTNLLYSATTNASGSALKVDWNLYHTFQIQNTTVRTNTCYLDRSLDGNWVPFYTNTFTTTGTVDTTLVGKWQFVRGRVDTITGTNCAVTFLYLGSH